MLISTLLFASIIPYWHSQCESLVEHNAALCTGVHGSGIQKKTTLEPSIKKVNSSEELFFNSVLLSTKECFLCLTLQIVQPLDTKVFKPYLKSTATNILVSRWENQDFRRTDIQNFYLARDGPTIA